MPRPRVALAAVFLILALVGCNSPAVPPQLNYAIIYGVVYDGASGQPLGGATVTVDSVLTATTGSNGQFTIYNVPIGPFTSAVSAPGYQQQQSSGTVAAGDRFLLNVSLYK